jgi:hypothetical protein
MQWSNTRRGRSGAGAKAPGKPVEPMGPQPVLLETLEPQTVLVFEAGVVLALLKEFGSTLRT